jgi:hypothetical protein
VPIVPQDMLRTCVMIALLAALAFDTVGAGAQIPTDRGGVRFQVDATGLEPGRATYGLTLERPGEEPERLGWRAVSVSETVFAGASAWVLVEERSSPWGHATDTLLMNPSTFRPLRWGAAQSRAHLGLVFSGDSVFGAATGPAGRQNILMGIPPRTLVNAAMVEVLFRLVTLYPDWRDSLNVVTVGLGGADTVPAELLVIGEEEIRVPAGVFDCWIVALGAGESQTLYWVSKRNRVVVKTRQLLPRQGGAQLVSLLERPPF